MIDESKLWLAFAAIKAKCSINREYVSSLKLIFVVVN